MSLRTHILTWHGLLLTCVLAAFGITAHRLHWDGELDRVDHGLDEPLALLHRSLHGQSGRGGSPPRDGSSPPKRFELPEALVRSFEARGLQYGVWNRSGTLLARSDGIPGDMGMPSVSGQAPFVIQRRLREGLREAYLITPPGECFLVAVSVREELAAATRLGWWLLALGAGVLVAGLLVDAWILRRAIRPVEEIISAAERITAGNLSTRIEAKSGAAELGRLAKVLNDAFNSVERVITQQSRFTADAAHELRTPVSILMVEAQSALEREREDVQYRETISTVLRTAQRMSGLIESLLDLAMLDSASTTSRESCDLALISREVVNQHRTCAAAHQITVEQNLSGAPCSGDVARLTQVITNLLMNAIQHNEPGGHVKIQTGMDDGAALLRVENTGPGIPGEDMPHVFERFYRADASRSRRTGGSGLGLAICKSIADAHGAALTLGSTPSGGTWVCLRLPGSSGI